MLSSGAMSQLSFLNLKYCSWTTPPVLIQLKCRLANAQLNDRWQLTSSNPGRKRSDFSTCRLKIYLPTSKLIGFSSMLMAAGYIASLFLFCLDSITRREKHQRQGYFLVISILIFTEFLSSFFLHSALPPANSGWTSGLGQPKDRAGPIK